MLLCLLQFLTDAECHWRLMNGFISDPLSGQIDWNTSLLRSLGLADMTVGDDSNKISIKEYESSNDRAIAFLRFNDAHHVFIF